ncbi:MAG: SLC13 family permease [Nitrospinota bacterium]
MNSSTDKKVPFALFLSMALPLLLLAIPTEALPLTGMTVLGHRMLAIFLLATLFWILEPVPVFATSVLIIFLELLLISDKALPFLRPVNTEAISFTPISYKAVMAVFSSPIILLFIGGFFLANASKKYKLDQLLTRVCILPFGKKTSLVIFGVMSLTAVLSMFMSNTATTAMMLAIIMPLLKNFKDDDKGRVAMILAVPFAANLGGLGTPIGTPPNAVALKYLIGENTISFGTWMLFGVPYVFVMLLFTWVLLLALFPINLKEVHLKLDSRTRLNKKALIVYVTFGLTVLLWVTDRIHGINAYIVAMLPIVVFTLTGVMGAEDLKKISWDVLWLVAGGLALGFGMEKTGLSKNIVDSIAFSEMPALLIISSISFISVVMATFMSNTATANLILPIVFVLGSNTPALAETGGSKILILATTFACSLAMSLPVSTPPNAIAYASGIIKSEYLIKAGLIIGMTGLTTLFGMLFILNLLKF